MRHKLCVGFVAAIAVALTAGLAFAGQRYASVGVSPEAAPFTLTDKVMDFKEVDFVQTNELDFAAAMLESERNVQMGLPLRFAIPARVDFGLDNAGSWEDLQNGSWLWRLRVASPNALSINLGFFEYHMPAGATLTLLTPDGAEVVRPFTSADNQPGGQLWTPVLNAEEIVLEVVVPAKRIPELRLRIGQIGAGFRRFGVSEESATERGTSGSCNVDVACPEGDPWADEIDAAGCYTVGGIDTCSGSMINNTAQDRTPYFLTANHCGIGVGNAGSVVIYWNFQNSYCRVPGSGDSGGPGNGSLAQFSTGTTFRASASVSDFCLVQVNTAPPQSWGVNFAGWSREGLNPDSGACIHHPQVAEKRITFFSDVAGGSFAHSHGSSWGCSAAPGPGDNTHISAYWSLGVTEPGSSGSPLYDDNHRIIGQLHGGPSSCSATGANRSDCYGRVSRSWTGNGTSSTRLSDWLDPGNTGAMFVDTLGPGMSVSPGADTTHYGVLGGPFAPASITYTLNNPTPTPINYSVSIVGGGTAPLTLDGGSGPVGGVLGAASSVDVTVAVDAVAAAALSTGVYSTTVAFDDLTNGVTNNRVHNIDAGTTGFTTSPATGLLSGGPNGGPFSGMQVYTVTSTRPTPVTVRTTVSDSWISLDGGAGPVNVVLNGVGDSANIVVGFSSDANLLANGIYNGSVQFTNLNGGDGDTSRAVTLDVGRYTYSFGGPPIAIPDNNAAGITSILSVSDAFCVGDVDVEVNITHTFRGDLQVELISPEGTIVRLHNRTGGGTDNLIATYDDSVLPPDGPGLLADFNGEPSMGNWTLSVKDLAGSDIGSLNSWKLKIAAAGVTCPPTAQNVSITVPDTVTSPIMLDATSAVGAPLTYTLLSLPTNGDLYDPNGGLIASAPYSLLALGNVVNYKPDSLYVGSDSFTYKATDSQDSNTATVDIDVGGPQVIYDFPLNSNPGWTTGAGWAFGVPLGAGGDPNSGHTGSNVYGYNLAGAYAANLGRTYLTAGPFDLTDRTNASIEFWRWLGIEQATYDHAGVEVSNNGTTWTLVWQNPTGSGLSITDTAWQFQSFNISAVADNQPTVYVRWFLGTTDGSVQYSGWNIDDIQIKAVVPPTPPTNCAGDADNDLDVDFDDITAAIANWGASYTPGSDSVGDADDDGDVDFDDITASIANWGSDCSK